MASSARLVAGVHIGYDGCMANFQNHNRHTEEDLTEEELLWGVQNILGLDIATVEELDEFIEREKQKGDLGETERTATQPVMRAMPGTGGNIFGL